MRKFYLVLAAAAILAFMAPNAHSQVNNPLTNFTSFLEFNHTGGGARAAGMGGAYLGLSEGEYAFSWNPGALIFAEKNQMGIQFASTSDKFTTDHEMQSPNLNVSKLQQIEAKREHIHLDFGGFNVPFSFMDRTWAFGGGYRNVYDMNINYDFDSFFGDVNTQSTADGVDAISVAISGLLFEGIGVGVTANSYVRGTESNQWYLKSVEIASTTDPYPDTADIWDNETSHYSGVNFDIGLAASMGMFKGGVVVHTPYNLKQNVKFTRTFMLAPLPIGTINRITYTTSMPLGYSAGIAVTPIEKFTLAMDFDYRPMSEVETDVDWEIIDAPDYTYDPNWENLTQFRIGAEYTIDAGFASLPLRAGFRNNPSVAKEWFGNGNDPEFGDQITTTILTFGSGLHFERAWIDFGYQFGSSSYDSHIIYFDEDKNIEQKRDYSRLLISAGMYF